jgi:hypothetical protein
VGFLLGGSSSPIGGWRVAGVRERGGQDLRKDCPGGFPSLVSIRIGQRE